jgi:hypothetical protein
MTPGEIRFELERTLLLLANERGMVPLIMGIHSVVVEGNTVSVGYDIVPGDEVLFFDFERPALVSPDDVRDFASWLAWSGRGETVH